MPHEEDFGLVTLEAMRAGKPVITASDSGGTAELVSHGETGLVVEPTPEALAAAIDELWSDRRAAKRMGRAGLERARKVTWDGLVRELEAVAVKPKLVVATSFPIWPPRGGGQSRIFGLYAALARLGVDVDVVALVGRGEHGGTRALAPGAATDARAPGRCATTSEEYRLHLRAGVPVTDIGARAAPRADARVRRDARRGRRRRGRRGREPPVHAARARREHVGRR